MPTTTNYGWTDPTPGGSTGTWDDILNALFQEIDDELFRVEGLIGPGLTAQYNILAITGQAQDWGVAYQVPGQVMVPTPTGIVNAVPLQIALPQLRAGQRIVSFRTTGSADIGGAVAQSRLVYRANATAVRSVVSGGHTLPASIASTETASLTHDVLPDVTYFVEVTPTASNENTALINVAMVSVSVIPTP